MAKSGPLNTPFTRDPFSAPSPMSKFGKCTEGNPSCCSSPGDDTSVVGIVLYHDSEGLKSSSAALVSPQGTGITGLGKPKGS